jgi:predicted dithiol-disulfide oxidoreductase (DUF899 family)
VQTGRVPDPDAAYAAKREELRLAEIELMRHGERVAALRRALPPGPCINEYEFIDLGTGGKVQLSELFTAPDRALVIYHFMYGKKQTSACPMCTMWIDGYNAVAHHLAQNVDFAVVAAADPPTLHAHADARGWDRLRLLSCGDNTFKRDFESEDAEGNQDSTITVFARDADGNVRLTYLAHPSMAPDIRERGIDLLSPVWHILDLTPRGRGDWYASLTY